MSRDIAALSRKATDKAVAQCVESGRDQLDTPKPTISSGHYRISTKSSNEEKIKQDSAPPSLELTRHDKTDNTHNDKDLNEIAGEIRDIILDGNDGLGRKHPKHQGPAVKQLDQNINKLKDGVRCTSHTMASVLTGDSPSPLADVSTYRASTLIEERPQSIPIMVDEPDPRLIDALWKPLDRPLILKVEQEVIAFITGTLDSYDTSPLNSYHRMLVHKIAEFYRLTHIASPYAADCVRLFRGRAARIPPVKLSDMISQKTSPATPPSGTQLAAVKIMRRKSPSQKGVDGETDQIGDGGGGGGPQSNDLLKVMTREEREAAYQLARARIFGDFKESPPESPSPSKCSNEKQMLQRNSKEQDDGFQSRSQYPYCIGTQTFPNFGGPGSRFSSNPCNIPGLSEPTQTSHALNPAAASFSPNSGAFTLAPPTGPVQPALSQQYPVIFTNRGALPVYPPIQISNIPNPATQPNLNRPGIPLSADRFTSITLPYGPQNSHGNAMAGNSQFPSTNHGFGHTTTDSRREYHGFGQITDQHTDSDATYSPSFPYCGQKGSASGTVNRRMGNAGWSPVGVKSIEEQGGFLRAEDPLESASRNFESYGVGRG